jgi:hypothetical protein
MLFKISDYLKKVSKFSDDKESLDLSVISTFRNILGLELLNSDFVLKDGILVINKSPVVKSEIMLKKNRLLNSINSHLNNKKVFDIR